MSEVYKVGRMGGGGKVTHVFNIRRADDGGIKLSKVEGLKDHERHELFVHFGKPHMARTGGEEDGVHWEGIAKVMPGTVDHFRKAVMNLPGMFKVMG